eukprot:TRINITY_DN5929_c0_g1_i1.p1 TRINITY_DN5929_c0_g1~~TRINITY_DN5929_c0_g1_i1.p1  ORF type:complete len:835 (+),score=135.02 TRINITY_DN5929_c0_g1_i1:53-2506(+)
MSKMICNLLSSNYKTRKSICANIPVHEYDGQFEGKPAHFKVTSVIGHIYETEFEQRQNWDVDIITIFDVPLCKIKANKTPVAKQLKKEAKGCDKLILWLDCDREGENICFEVMKNTLPFLNDSGERKLYRAKFSSMTRPDLLEAMNNLGYPNENESRSVDARQELDFRVGIAFSRFQTQYFQKYNELSSQKITYGPCQTPTLAFCVERYDKIATFESEPFWKLTAHVRKDYSIASAKCLRGRIFDKNIAKLLYNGVLDERSGLIHHVKESRKTKPKPQALNTVHLLKVASQFLNVSPHTAMDVAQSLYMRGYITYPRTESTKYNPNFNVHGILSQHTGHPLWGEFVRNLLDEGLKRPKGGKDEGDHPPITPTRCAGIGELSGLDWRVYEYITRHFIGTLSTSCAFLVRKTTFSIGDELFETSGKKLVREGFVGVMPWLMDNETNFFEGEIGDRVEVQNIELQAKETKPPSFLTESDLISLMEKNGIGTDASIANHIKTIESRRYVNVDGSRHLIPTKLGIALVHGYQRIDPELVLPRVRAAIEEYISYIAIGSSDYEEVVGYSIGIFREKFLYLSNNINKMDELFEASFVSVETNAKLKPQCGKCRRHMKFINTTPKRLYCENCEETYKVPNGQNAKFRYHENSAVCPICKFSIVTAIINGGLTKNFCPYCHNHPPYPIQPEQLGMTCSNCSNEACKLSQIHDYVGDCTSCDFGKILLDGRHVNLFCNICNSDNRIKLPRSLESVQFYNGEICECGNKMLKFKFQERKPFEGKHIELVACYKCFPNLIQTHGSGGRGRGRGRGRRGRGRKKRGKKRR